MANEPNRQSEHVLGELDSPGRSSDLAELSAYSRPQFFRRAKRLLGEPPMGARRRLLLERAAYRLARGDQSVTEAAFDAAFESLEGFSRAFKKAFGLTPSAYRELAPDEYRVDLSERLHYAPPNDGSGQPRQGEAMKIPELMTDHHAWQMGHFLNACSGMTDEQLDAKLPGRDPFPWITEPTSLRYMLSWATAFAAPWMHAINGIKTDYHPLTIEAMREALPINRAGFLDILRAVEADNSYDLTFVDAICEPPEVFSYGGVIAHVLTHVAYRRAAISNHLHSLGIEFVETPDAMGMPKHP